MNVKSHNCLAAYSGYLQPLMRMTPQHSQNHLPMALKDRSSQRLGISISPSTQLCSKHIFSASDYTQINLNVCNYSFGDMSIQKVCKSIHIPHVI